MTGLRRCMFPRQLLEYEWHGKGLRYVMQFTFFPFAYFLMISVQKKHAMEAIDRGLIR